MTNKNNKDNNLQKKPADPININNNEYEEEYEFIQVNVATGDQYRKFANIRSKGGQITSEMVNKFHDESTKEAQQWRFNNPRVESITFREARDKNDKQVIKILPTELIFPSEQRVKIYDENGIQIIGEENIRREIEKRGANWEQWEKEGKLKVVDHRTHDFDDGSIATVYSRIAPIKLHENEANEVSNHLAHVSKRLKIFGEESKESREHNKVVGSSQVKGKIVEVVDDSNMDIDQSSGLKLPTDSELEKASKDELESLIRRVKNELKKRENKVNENQDSDTDNVSTQVLGDTLSRAESRMQTLNNSFFNNDTPNNSNVGGIFLAVVGVISASAVGSIALLKSKFSKSKK